MYSIAITSFNVFCLTGRSEEQLVAPLLYKEKIGGLFNNPPGKKNLKCGPVYFLYFNTVKITSKTGKINKCTILSSVPEITTTPEAALKAYFDALYHAASLNPAQISACRRQYCCYGQRGHTPLLTASGKCYPAIGTITRDLKLPRSTVKRTTADLVKSGHLCREQRWRENGGKSSCMYYLR